MAIPTNGFLSFFFNSLQVRWALWTDTSRNLSWHVTMTQWRETLFSSRRRRLALGWMASPRRRGQRRSNPFVNFLLPSFPLRVSEGLDLEMQTMISVVHSSHPPPPPPSPTSRVTVRCRHFSVYFRSSSQHNWLRITTLPNSYLLSCGIILYL